MEANPIGRDFQGLRSAAAAEDPLYGKRGVPLVSSSCDLRVLYRSKIHLLFYSLRSASPPSPDVGMSVFGAPVLRGLPGLDVCLCVVPSDQLPTRTVSLTAVQLSTSMGVWALSSRFRVYPCFRRLCNVQ